MLRPTFMGFETAKRGLTVAQKGIDIAGNNMANETTPGYTRQRMDQVSLAASNYRSRFATNRVGVAGQGVEITGISQVRDSFLDKRYRDEYGSSSYYDQKTASLRELADAIDEKNNVGILDALNESLGPALTDFIKTSDSETLANNLATSFKNLTLLLRQYSQNLDSVAEQQKYDLKLSVDEMNTTFNRLADLNKIISEDLGILQSGKGEYYGPNELLDERNLLLDQLAKYGDMNVENMPDGTVTVKMGGKTVVEGSKAENITYTPYNDAGTVALRWQADGKAVVFSRGSIKASMEVINGRGSGVTDSTNSTDKGILYYKDKINAFAATLADKVNKIFPEKLDGDGNPIVEPDGTIKYKTLIGARVFDEATGKYVTSTDVPITADNISISDEWAKKSDYIIIEPGSTTTNKYAMNLQGVLFTQKNTFNTPGETYVGTFEEYVKDYSLSSLGAETSYLEDRYKSHELMRSQIDSSRDEVSAVSQNEEQTNLMMFSKCFQAASRLMNTLDEALNIIINNMGLVGR